MKAHSWLILIVTISLICNACALQCVDIGTGEHGGLYYEIGSTLCGIVNDAKNSKGENNLDCAVQDTPGAIFNINALYSNNLDFAFIPSYAAHITYSGISDKAAGLMLVLPLYTESLAMVVRKDSTIKNFFDIAGHIVNIGPPGSGAQYVIKSLLQQAKISKDDLKLVTQLRVADQAELLCSGKIDVAVYWEGHPNKIMLDAEKLCDIRIISIEDELMKDIIRERSIHCFIDTIPANTYKHQERAISSLASIAGLYTIKQDHNPAIQGAISAIFDNLDNIGINPNIYDKTHILNAIGASKIPLHPYVAKYYAELKF